MNQRLKTHLIEIEVCQTMQIWNKNKPNSLGDR